LTNRAASGSFAMGIPMERAIVLCHEKVVGCVQ
jgi:hypothetical protein